MLVQTATITMIDGSVFEYEGKEREDVTTSINASIVGRGLASIPVKDANGKECRVVAQNIVYFAVSHKTN